MLKLIFTAPRRVAAALFALALALPAGAQIVIGQSAAFTGPVAAGVQETTAGAKLYFDAVNAAGGVNGKLIELVSLDDKFDPKLAGDNARKLIVENRALALFLSRGTPHTQAMLPALMEFKVPLVGPSPARWPCTSRCTPTCSTCAPPTSARPNAQSST